MTNMKTVIESTGQTHDDIAGLADLGIIIPGFVPPATYWPNYKPPVATESLYIVTFVMLILSFICLTLRIFARQTSNNGHLLAEDWVFALGFIFTLGLCTCTLLAISRYTYGRHTYDMTISNLQNTLYADYIFQTMLLMATPLLRISVALFVKRLHKEFMSTRKQLKLCNGVIAFNIVLCIATLLGSMVQCTPLPSTYILYVQATNNCQHRPLQNFFISGFCFIANIISLLLPLGLVLRLRTYTERRVESILMFILGSLATACAGARFVSLFKTEHSHDPLYDTSKTAIYSVLECSFIIMAACIPSIRSYIQNQSYSESCSGMIGSIRQRLRLGNKPAAQDIKNTSDNELFQKVDLDDEKKMDLEHEDDHHHYEDEIVIVPTQSRNHFYV